MAPCVCSSQLLSNRCTFALLLKYQLFRGIKLLPCWRFRRRYPCTVIRELVMCAVIFQFFNHELEFVKDLLWRVTVLETVFRCFCKTALEFGQGSWYCHSICTWMFGLWSVQYLLAANSSNVCMLIGLTSTTSLCLSMLVFDSQEMKEMWVLTCSSCKTLYRFHFIVSTMLAMA